MVDITLSSDRIRTAPIAVRRWIENEVAASLDVPEAAPMLMQHEHLVSCSPDHLAQVFDLLQGMPPVTAVFFELGMNGGRELPGNVAMLRLADVAQHARMQTAAQVVSCIKIINQAFQELSGDRDAVICAIDEEERCYLKRDTQDGIRELWHGLVEAHEFHSVHSVPGATRMSCAPPYSLGMAPIEMTPPSPDIIPVDELKR